jgi:outer membrane protein assembly factor BamB
MHNEARKIIGATGRNMIIVNPETGNIDWTFNDWGRKEEGEENIAVNTPLCDNGRVFFSFGNDIGAFMLRLGIYAGDARVGWRNNDLDTHTGGFVLVDNIIYGSNWINNDEGNWVAVDWNTGETKYQE